MPNSLKCRLKKLAYQGLISKKDLSRIYTDNDIIAELEKIKSKMEVRVKHNNDLENYDISTGLSMALGILENRISELKGE